MTKNSGNIFFVYCLWTCFTLAIFASSVNSIYKFNVDTFNAGCAANNLLQARDKDLNFLTEACI